MNSIPNIACVRYNFATMNDVSPTPDNPPVKPPRPSPFASYWPKMDSRESAEKALRTAAGFAAFQAVIIAIVAIIAIVVRHPIIGLNAWALLDSALMAIVSWRLSKFSLAWAIVAVIYQTANVIERVSEAGTTGLFIGLAFLLIYIGAVRGASYLRKHRHDALAPASDSAQ